MIKGKNDMKEICKSNMQCEMSNMDRKWKEKDKQYLEELQRFFDHVDNIKDRELRKNVRNQMLMCDKALTEIAERMFYRCYNEGYKKAKKG